MQISRRAMLKAAGGTAAAGILAPGALTACGKSASKNTTAANTKVKLPTYVAYTGVNPDLSGNTAGVLPAFYSYPKQPAKAASGTPGHGGSITGFANIYAAVPPPVGVTPIGSSSTNYSAPISSST